MKLRFHLPAFIAFLLLLLVEILIALYVHDRLLRPFGGDVLVVVLIYYFIRAFTNIRQVPAIIGVFVFACAVEAAQAFNLVQLLGLQHSRFWTIVIGTSFSWLDILAYALGALLTLLAERLMAKARARRA